MSLGNLQTSFISKLRNIDNVSNIYATSPNAKYINFTYNNFKLVAVFAQPGEIRIKTFSKPGEIVYLGKRNVIKLSASQLNNYFRGLLENTVQTYRYKA